MSRLDDLYGADDLDALFGHGHAKAACPFPSVGRLKQPEPQPEIDFLAPVHLALLDPRTLWGSQPWVLREHTAYYRTGRWEQTGETSADRDQPSNWYPLVTTDRLGRSVIRAGHHRAVAALLRGSPLLARVVPESTDRAVAVLPHVLLGRTSGLPHLKCRSAGEIVHTVREGRTALCEDAAAVVLAARALSPGIEPTRLRIVEGIDPLRQPTILWAGIDNPRDVTGAFLLCTDCGGLRSPTCPAAGFAPDLCSCQPRPPLTSPDASEHLLACRLCQVCGLHPVKGHIRWRRVVCNLCLPKVREFNRRAGRTIIPPGIHSLVNGGPMLDLQDAAQSPATLDAFAEQLQAMFKGVSGFREWADARLLERLRNLGFGPGRTVPLEEYLDACRAAGIDEHDGWARLTAPFWS